MWLLQIDRIPKESERLIAYCHAINLRKGRKSNIRAEIHKIIWKNEQISDFFQFVKWFINWFEGYCIIFTSTMKIYIYMNLLQCVCNSDKFRECFTIDCISLQWSFDILLKYFDIIDHLLGSLLIEWIIWIRFNKQEENTWDYVVEVQDGFPICSEDIETHIALQINVRMVNFSVTMNFWRLMGIICTNFNWK